jgi:hypothetical protein
MGQHRGRRETAQDLYEGVVVDLVVALGNEPESYAPRALRTFVYERARTHGLDRTPASGDVPALGASHAGSAHLSVRHASQTDPEDGASMLTISLGE